MPNVKASRAFEAGEDCGLADDGLGRSRFICEADAGVATTDRSSWDVQRPHHGMWRDASTRGIALSRAAGLGACDRARPVSAEHTSTAD